ncbi:MAG: sigma-70 family RNA polymerase sigma factor [Candidatus Latescibacteria bacterium]|nr:sigma-70 family RNA polymerase sigma factor [Candidatus Latescibacterota bacterium]
MADSDEREMQAADRYGGLVLQLAWRVLHDPEEARDVYQETFLKYFTALRRGERITYPKAWLSRTAQNEAVERARTRTRRRELLRQKPQLETVEIEQAAERRLLIEKIRQFALDLPEQQRAVFVLRNFQSLPFKEIAQIVGCQVSTARAHEYKAVVKLRYWLSELGGADG